MLRAPGCNCEFVRSDRIAIRIENSYDQMGIVSIRIKDAKGFMTGELRCVSAAAGWDVTFRNYPASVSNFIIHKISGHLYLLMTDTSVMPILKTQLPPQPKLIDPA